MLSPQEISSQLNHAEQQGYLNLFIQSARQNGIDPAVWLAVGSKESGLGTDTFLLTNNWTGRDGHGKGLVQIDDRFHAIAKVTRPNFHQILVPYGAKYLGSLKNQFGDIRPAISAYNAGPGDVEFALGRGLDPDLFTTGKNYAKDVLQRAEIIKQMLPSPNINKASVGAGILLLLVGGTLLSKQLDK